jgi:hypothetical protein
MGQSTAGFERALREHAGSDEPGAIAAASQDFADSADTRKKALQGEIVQFLRDNGVRDLSTSSLYAMGMYGLHSDEVKKKALEYHQMHASLGNIADMARAKLKTVAPAAPAPTAPPAEPAAPAKPKTPRKKKALPKRKPAAKSLAPVQDIMRQHGLEAGSDDMQELTGFKHSIMHHQRLSQKQVRQMQEEGTPFWPRNAAKLKASFLRNMDPSNYSSPEAFRSAQERIKKMPTTDFAKVLAAIMSEEEEGI